MESFEARPGESSLIFCFPPVASPSLGSTLATFASFSDLGVVLSLKAAAATSAAWVASKWSVSISVTSWPPGQ